MPNVLSEGTDLLAHVEEDSLVIHSKSAENVRSQYWFPSHPCLTLIKFLVAGCRSDDECPLTEACYDRECSDPCLYQECGTNAICTARIHRAFCHCREGTKGNPYESCRPYECLIDSDCHDTLKCENEKCVDPCACAQFADCSPRNHRGVCTCFPDYTGNPYGIACDPSKIIDSISLDCIYSTLPYSFNSPRASCWRTRMLHRRWLS